MATTNHDCRFLPLFAFFFFFFYAIATTCAAATTESFIRSSCKSTRYPSLCISSLSSLPSPPLRPTPRSLASAALSISLHRARSASSFFTHLPSPSSQTRAGIAARDCLENLADSVDRIRSSIREMDHMGRAGSSRFAFHLDNVQTWVSAALTDEDTCLDGLSEAGKGAKSLRAAARRRIVAVARATSNALALVNRVASLI